MELIRKQQRKETMINPKQTDLEIVRELRLALERGIDQSGYYHLACADFHLTEREAMLIALYGKCL